MRLYYYYYYYYYYYFLLQVVKVKAHRKLPPDASAWDVWRSAVTHI